MGEPLGLVVGDIHMNLINSTITNNSNTITKVNTLLSTNNPNMNASMLNFVKTSEEN